jgi:16S rRNA (uracil1498-N3)-methyltransferase
MGVLPWVLVDPAELASGAVVALEHAEAHHLVAVRRRGEGQVVVTDGHGHVAQATVERRGRSTQVRLGEVRSCPPCQGGVSLAVAALHGQAMDRAVQQAVEVGVVRFIPVCTQRSQLSPQRVRSRAARWREIGRQALKQCRRAWELEIDEPLDLEQLLASVPAGRGLVADPSGTALHRLVIPAEPVMLIGPEGGLTGNEIDAISDAGWQKTSLGQYVLRAPTAAAVGAAWLAARSS